MASNPSTILTLGTTTCPLRRGFLLLLFAALVSSCRPASPSNTLQPVQYSLPICTSGAPESFPCRTSFDSAPLLLEPPPATVSDRVATPTVWIFVDETGRVKRTQIDQPAGVDFDIAAVGVARRLRFRPATLNGQPVGAWVRVPITTGPALSCPTMLVPVSAGVAVLADSETLERPELGTLYRYSDEGGRAFDVFVYPMASWPEPKEQASVFLQAMTVEQQQGRFTSVDVVDHGALDVVVKSRGRAREMRLRGHQVLLRLEGPSGVEESFFAVFPSGQRYYKVRATYVESRRVREHVKEFLRQLLSALGSRDPGCS